jgi:queuine tRNA-ribosyltransferase
LLKVGELLATQLIAQHNVAVMTRLMREIRAAIKNGTLDSLEREWIED